jgi:hypothetical protein
MRREFTGARSRRLYADWSARQPAMSTKLWKRIEQLCSFRLLAAELQRREKSAPKPEALFSSKK